MLTGLVPAVGGGNRPVPVESATIVPTSVPVRVVVIEVVAIREVADVDVVPVVVEPVATVIVHLLLLITRKPLI